MDDPTAPLQQAMDIAFSDVLAAFTHYIDNHNEGRPFFLASHSQGTMHQKRILAYVPRYPITRATPASSADSLVSRASLARPLLFCARRYRHIAAALPHLTDRLVAAYLIGNTIGVDELPFPACTQYNQTGCLVSWNAMIDGADPSHWLQKLEPGTSKMVCTNRECEITLTHNPNLALTLSFRFARTQRCPGKQTPSQRGGSLGRAAWEPRATCC
jgi:hypothetical protein